MKRLAIAMTTALLSAAPALASGASDALAGHLYAGTAAEGLDLASDECDQQIAESCFAAGMLSLVMVYEALSEDLYTFGAVMPADNLGALYFGFGLGANGATEPANPEPLAMSYPDMRGTLETFLAGLDVSRGFFERAGAEGDYVIAIDPFKVRMDFNGDDAVDQSENLGALIANANPSVDFMGEENSQEGKSKSKTTPPAPPDTTIGFDRADAIWFAGYSQVVAAPVELILAHDFSDFFDAYMHQVFPKAGLPMQAYTNFDDVTLDFSGSTGLADVIAAVHTFNFAVTNPQRLAKILDRLKAATAFSRQNWELILAETDDNREWVPSPDQASMIPGFAVTTEKVAAWQATLDRIDDVLDGKLLVPHWRFKQGLDLRAYFTTAERTDPIMLITGSAALPYLRDGPIADAASFAEANAAFGAEWLNYALWFN